MMPFEDYKFANMSDEMKNQISEMESKLSSNENKKVVLIAYEQNDEVEN